MGTGASEEFMTTSDAAKHCGVTRFTIRNWIVKNKLRASRTAGRHHRVFRSDLLKLMKEAGIHPARQTDDPAAPIFCWEFRDLTGAKGHECSKCLVFKERSNRCFLTVHDFGPDKVRCGQACPKCDYMETYFPREKAVMTATLDRVSPEVRSPAFNGKNKAAGKRLYRSGRYLAAFKNIFSRTK